MLASLTGGKLGMLGLIEILYIQLFDERQENDSPRYNSIELVKPSMFGSQSETVEVLVVKILKLEKPS